MLDASEDDLYGAMDWLLAGQDRIQMKLGSRHLKDDGLVLYDLSSSYFEGVCCPLAKLGYSRDGKRGTLQVNYGLLTDERGCPVAVSVFDGNTSDSTTFMPEVKRLREQFGIQRMVMVGDRGMISKENQGAIDEMSQDADVAWITALRSASIRTLVEQQHLQLDLFDERNLLEISSPDYPGERLLACRNPQLARLRAHTRDDLLLATEQNLQKIKARVDAARLAGKDQIGVAVGKMVNQFKVAKHFELLITDNAFTFTRKAGPIALEAAMAIDAALRRFAGRLSAMQLDPELGAAYEPQTWRRWREWIVASMNALASGNGAIAPSPALAAGPRAEALARIARQIGLMAGAIERVRE